jgi:hypothetical protein
MSTLKPGITAQDNSRLSQHWGSLAVVFLGLLSGCTRTPPYERLVEAEEPIRLAMWRSSNRDLLTSQEWTLFDESLNELKIQIMLEGKASGSESVDAMMREKINGMRLCDVLPLGLQIRVVRLKAELAELTTAVAINARIKINPDDDEKVKLLAGMKEEQAVRLEKLKVKVAAAEADLLQIRQKFFTPTDDRPTSQ